MELFKDFLRTEFSEENVEFWIACEEYKNVKSNKLNARAEEIFSDYVAVQAPREVCFVCLLGEGYLNRNANYQTFHKRLV